MPPTGRHQLLIYDYVEDMAERRGPHREGHLALIAQWQADGRIVVAGALGDPVRQALLCFSLDADPEQFAAHDPYVANGLVTGRRVEPWTLV